MIVSCYTQGVHGNWYNSGNDENNNKESEHVGVSPIKDQRTNIQGCVIREQIGAKKLVDIFSNVSLSKIPTNNRLLQGLEHTFIQITVLLVQLGISPQDVCH